MKFDVEKFKELAEYTLNLGEQILVKRPETIEKSPMTLHHDITTDNDIYSQNKIIQFLTETYPESHIIAEEKTDQKNILTEQNFLEHINELVFGIDPIDGTSQYANNLYEWAISIGATYQKKPVGGVVFAPKIGKGYFLFSANNTQTISLNNGYIDEANVSQKKNLRDCVVNIGVDTLTRYSYRDFVSSLALESRTLSVNGSCALGLALVANGELDLFIQPPQRVWDWYGGWSLVENANGKVIFYKINNSRIERINELKDEHFNPAKKEIGFISGNEQIAEQCFELLKKKYKN
jgi:fructose-1,6-bisphosphatase/inositol monophosphatase family enzyme